MKRLLGIVPLAAALAGGSMSALAQADRSILVLLDASSSMIKPLPNKERKIRSAKEAVETFVKRLPPLTRLGLRAYGHQSNDSQKDCRDTELLVDLEPAPAVENSVVRRMTRLRARGYSPISFALNRSTEDFVGERAQTRMIVLVSDGKETCAGDPCATARKLSRSDPRLIVHTIGFSVGDVARDQLRCIARVANGKYYDAGDARELSDRLYDAYTFLPTLARKVIIIDNPTPGKITVRNPGAKHLIKEAESGAIITAIGNERASASLPPGFYNVTFGNGVWKSVEVEAGNETILRPGTLEIRNPSVLGHPIYDPDTNEVINEITPGSPSMALVPDTVYVRFGKAVWRDVVIKNGRKTVLDPGQIRIAGAELRGVRMRRYPIYDIAGLEVGALSLSHPTVPLPPGTYTVDIFGRQVPVKLVAGQTVVLKVQ